MNKSEKLLLGVHQLDVYKPMTMYIAEDSLGLVETTKINSSIPQMQTGMTKDEEIKRNFQQSVVVGTVIPTPEVKLIDDLSIYNQTYSGDFQMPKRLIRTHPFDLKEEYSEYDADSEDEEWLHTYGKSLNIDIDKFETIIDKLEKNTNHSVITLLQSIVLLKESKDVVTAVYDYWLSKRLRLQHSSLIPSVQTKPDLKLGNNPCVFKCFNGKIQTIKNSKNDNKLNGNMLKLIHAKKNRENKEKLYEKMLRLKKDLSYSHNLFQMIRKRENLKLQLAILHMETYQKRYEAKDFNGTLIDQLEDIYYKRCSYNRISNGFDSESNKDRMGYLSSELLSDENTFSFKRKENCDYLALINRKRS